MTQGLTASGWFFLIFGWGFILTLTIYCFSRVLFAKKPEIVVEAGGREQWGSRIGLILAVAGNAIGLGNFLRFPVQASSNGGGAFMIPYFVAFLLLGIPMMWVEWTIGRMGGAHGHGTTPGMLNLLWKKAPSKYLGALGIVIPFVIVIYYNFIESWCLGFSWFSLTGKYFGHANREAMGHFLHGFQGLESNEFFSSMVPILIFWVITIGLNFFFLYKGISKGIEVLAKYGMPLLFIFGIVLVVRVLTLGTPDPSAPELNISTGLGFIWNPDFGRLGSATVWLAAAGQIFFTLSLGQGIINTYASYVREKQDITLNGLSTASTNEFAEVILGGTIAIPAAVIFFGAAETQAIAQGGAFNLGFQALPVIFQKIPLGQIFGGMFFFLLFIAGITSSVAMTQPAIAFLEDEFKWKRQKAVKAVFARAHRLQRDGHLLLPVRLPRRARLLGRHVRPGRLRGHRDRPLRLGLRAQEGLGRDAQGRRPQGAEDLQGHHDLRHAGLPAHPPRHVDRPGRRREVPDEGRGVGPQALPLGRPGPDRRSRPAHVPAHPQGLEQEEAGEAGGRGGLRPVRKRIGDTVPSRGSRRLNPSPVCGRFVPRRQGTIHRG